MSYFYRAKFTFLTGSAFLFLFYFFCFTDCWAGKIASCQRTLTQSDHSSLSENQEADDLSAIIALEEFISSILSEKSAQRQSNLLSDFLMNELNPNNRNLMRILEIIHQSKKDPTRLALYELSNLDSLLNAIVHVVPKDLRTTILDILNRQPLIEENEGSPLSVFPYRSKAPEGNTIVLDAIGEEEWLDIATRKDRQSTTNRLPVILELLSTNPFSNPQLHSKDITNSAIQDRQTTDGFSYVQKLKKPIPNDAKLFQSYVENSRPGAYRIFWYLQEKTIHIVGLRSHL